MLGEIVGLMKQTCLLVKTKDLCLDKYKKVFTKNYIMNYTINQLPFIEEDAGIFDLEEMKNAKAQKYIEDNNLN